MRTFVISVAERPHRMDAFFARNGHLGPDAVTVSPAVTPGTLAGVLEGREPHFFAPGCTYDALSRAVAMSHISLWERCVALGEPVNILEDDIVLPMDYVAHRDAIWAACRADFLALGYNTDWPVEIDLNGAGMRVSMVFAQPVSDARPAVVHARKLLAIAGLCNYVLTPQGAERLLQDLLPIDSAREHILIDPGSILQAQVAGIAWSNRGLDAHLGNALGGIDARVCLPPVSYPVNSWQDSSFAREAHIFET